MKQGGTFEAGVAKMEWAGDVINYLVVSVRSGITYRGLVCDQTRPYHGSV